MWLSAVLSALMIANTLPSGVMASETATAFDPGDTTEKPLILWYNKPSAKTAESRLGRIQSAYTKTIHSLLQKPRVHCNPVHLPTHSQ